MLKFKSGEIYEIANKLGQSLISGTPEMRDSYADGLKTIISSVNVDIGEGISSKIIGYLLKGLANVNYDDLDGANFCLDVLECLVKTFGSKVRLLPLLCLNNLVEKL